MVASWWWIPMEGYQIGSCGYVKIVLGLGNQAVLGLHVSCIAPMDWLSSQVDVKTPFWIPSDDIEIVISSHTCKLWWHYRMTPAECLKDSGSRPRETHCFRLVELLVCLRAPGASAVIIWIARVCKMFLCTCKCKSDYHIMYMCTHMAI